MPFKTKLSPSRTAEKKNIIFQVLLVLGIMYFALFILPNATGAKTASMLQVFQVDEYAQYPNVLQMLTPGDSFYQSFRNFIIYLHYFYGYIFYFVSALALLLPRLLLGSQWTNHPQLLMLFLRQGVNVLPALSAVLLLTYLQTGFRSWLRSLGLFVLLLSMPALVDNNMWWHPDSLGLLLVVLVLFFLDKDELRFGRFFFLAAAACGLAVGVKYEGLFFVFSIGVYFLFGLASQKISWRRAAALAGGFVAVMAAAVVASNPLLLMPQERAALIQYQMLQYQQTMSGIILHNTQPFFENGQYPGDMLLNYGHPVFIILSLAALVVGLLRSPTRLRAALIFCFILPLGYTILNAATRRTHYWLPVLIPLFSCLVFLFPENEKGNESNNNTSPRFQFLCHFLPWLATAILITQLIVFVRTDIHFYTQVLNRETNSASLAFNRSLQNKLAGLPVQGQKYIAYRDWHVYFPDNARWRAEINWDLTTEHFIRDLNPDLILLEQENISLYNSPQAQANAVNPQDMQAAQKLYQAAALNQLPGYHIFYQDSFAVALMRDSLINQIK